MGRSGICINFNAMEQMWIDKGKINTLKTFIRQPLSKPIKMPAYFCNLLQSWLICSIHFKSLSVYTPRYLQWLTLIILIFPILISKSCSWCVPKVTKQVLSKFKLSLFAMNHWDKRNRYSFAVILNVTTSLLNMKRLVSSAYNLTVLKGNPLPISFTYIRKSSGPSIELVGPHM